MNQFNYNLKRWKMRSQERLRVSWCRWTGVANLTLLLYNWSSFLLAFSLQTNQAQQATKVLSILFYSNTRIILVSNFLHFCFKTSEEPGMKLSPFTNFPIDGITAANSGRLNYSPFWEFWTSAFFTFLNSMAQLLYAWLDDAQCWLCRFRHIVIFSKNSSLPSLNYALLMMGWKCKISLINVGVRWNAYSYIFSVKNLKRLSTLDSL